MSRITSTSSRHSARSASGRGMKAPLKSPLAMPSGAPVTPADYSADIEGAVLASVVLSDRNATLAEFEDYLRTVNNRDGRPYEEKMISNYVGPGKNLDVWMAASGLEGDFTVPGRGGAQPVLPRVLPRARPRRNPQQYMMPDGTL
jgi:hypothetical protein